MNLGYAHRRNARLYPNKLAVVDGDRRITFANLDNRINRLVNALLARGLRKGDRISILSKNCAEYFEFYGAAEKGGFIAVPLNFRLTPDELARLIDDSGPRALLVHREYLPAVDAIRQRCPTVEHFVAFGGAHGEYEDYEEILERASAAEPAVEISGDDIAYIIYTSGTTGLPRGAMLTHRGQLENAKSMTMELDMFPGDVYLGIMPLYHIGGKAVSFIHFYRGATNVVMRDFDPEGLLRTIRDERVTCVHVVPTMVAFMLDLPNVRSYDLSALRTMIYAAAPMPVALLRRAMDVFGPVFYQSYGQTESGPLISVLHKEDHRLDGPEARRLASAGYAAINVEMRVIGPDGADVRPGDVGGISVRSDFVMKGYWNNPELTAQVLRDGWLYTGDMATVDKDGYVYIVDRKKDMIISGGENIYPREIEEVLYRHPAVLEAAVIGVPDDKWGESVKAIVVLSPGKTATEREIVDHCKISLASYKKPKSVEFVSQLPKSPTGKILKRELRERYWQGQERRV